MKRFIYIISAFVSLSTAAQAADPTDGISSSVAVERIICKPAMVHTPSSDVAYQGGVDVNGNAVAPADINSAPQIVSSTYTEVPLNIDLAKKLNLSQPAVMESNFGNLKVYNDGRVLYNGQDISSNVNSLCGRAGEAPVPTNVPVPPRNVNVMSTPEVPMPGTAAPSSTMPAR
ncbi:MAG: hypothetical protein DI586_03795 [Micavibrio aeruginosavorus]|uniref:Uncharacterized protein n=1 Tax=Micavibrio aeruginosavorus TaxID=349221 RepID=A0A2W5FPS8_9BACT|nr:MAG: hypothetical protein DI586_03795 [Micavibrio aeruginosavorus]